MIPSPDSVVDVDMSDMDSDESKSQKSVETISMEILKFDNSLGRYLNMSTISQPQYDSENTEITPDYMKVPRLKFMMRLCDPTCDVQAVQKKIMDIIERNNMLPYYEKLCVEFKWKPDKNLIAQMKKANDGELVRLNSIAVDEENPAIVWRSKLDFYLSIGDSDAAYKLAFEKSNDTSLSTNNRLEATFALFRIAYCDNCNVRALHKAVEKAKHFIDSVEHKADWSGRNKFKAYEGIYGLAVRDYKRAATNLCDCISTFESYELTDFATIVKFTVIACMIALPRCEIQKKIVNYGLIMQELSCAPNNHLKEYVLSINECRYSDFLKALAIIEMALRLEPLTHPHYHQYVREMKLKAYAQMLQSYSTVSLKRMAEIFGVTEEYVEDDVHRFTATGNLTCRIDRVAGKVVTAHTGAIFDRAFTYQNSIKKGDMLLNRIKRLARIIDT